MSDIRLSMLPKTWFVDIDGVILRHNGWCSGAEHLLPGVREFWAGLGPEDQVILVTARPERLRKSTLDFLDRNDLHCNVALFGVPPGERIVINDAKPSGLWTAFALNLARDRGLADLDITLDESL
jgi:hypothetical protein